MILGKLEDAAPSYGCKHKESFFGGVKNPIIASEKSYDKKII